jgi:hypothetical protein
LADFKGPEPEGPYAGLTVVEFKLESVQDAMMIRAHFVSSKSGFKAPYKDSRNPAVNGCEEKLNECRSRFDRLEPNVSIPGGIPLKDGDCPATPRYSKELVATSKSECDSVLGPECNRVAEMEPSRVLNHEQFHMNMACVMADKGTKALQDNPTLRGEDVKKVVESKYHTQADDYDSQSKNGCFQALQKAWEDDINNGLPSVKIP